MNELMVAAVAAGAAVVASAVTGWFTRSAGERQAEAARRAGERQAEALLESVRVTLRGEATGRILEARRQTYTQFLGAAETRILTERTGRGQAGDDALLERALGGVLLEGPDGPAAAAQDLVDRLRRRATPDELRQAKLAFVAAAQEALAELSPLRGASG
ncbi:hypothetical protein [Streptomyces sp. NPDC005805]|uniref:hypothetical protein n=1 Tax=Streptomyces sp. NPDC005805 TaxID=3157068 RepID=UPI0033EC8267